MTPLCVRAAMAPPCVLQAKSVGVRLLLLLCVTLVPGTVLAAAPLDLPPEVEALVQAGEPARAVVELLVPGVPGGGAPPQAMREVRDRVLATLTPASRSAARRYGRLPFVAGRFQAQELAALALHPDVAAIHADRTFHPLLAETVPRVGADLVQAQGLDGDGAQVVILDTGVDAGHAMLSGSVVAEACFSSGRDCPNGKDTQVGPGAGTFCTFAQGCFHGTHVAGIAVGRPVPSPGVAPGAGVVSVQIFSEASGRSCAGQAEDPCAVSSTADLLAGMDHVLALVDGLDIAAVNMSVGGGAWSSESACDVQNGPIKTAADALIAAGIAVVASSGNESQTDALAAPACISSVIAVGASTDADGVWSASNDASFLDLLSPGVNVRSSVPFELFGFSRGTASGTSMAAPHVSGSLAILRQVAPDLSPAQALEVLRSTGVAITDGRTGRTHPRLAIAAATERLLGPECGNFADDDGDGLVDFPEDPGCASSTSAVEAPDCDDDVDNDGDGFVDWDGGVDGATPDPDCKSGSTLFEFPPLCGLGFEVAPLLVLWGSLRRRRWSRA